MSPTTSDLECVISTILAAGDSRYPPQITLSNFTVVCRAFAQQQDLLRFVSVVVEYTCTGHSNCLSGTLVQQIESGCQGGSWSNNVHGSYTFNQPFYILSPSPQANLSTSGRNDCSFCASPQVFYHTIDTITHCSGE